MQKLATGYEELMKNASSLDVVAKVVLDAVRNENPNLRYLAGKDLDMLLEARKNMSDVDLSLLCVLF
jgi:hypothetical protein